MNIALILLLVGLISSMGVANACPIIEVYHITSHDVTVKQGERAFITAFLYKQYYMIREIPPYDRIYGAPQICYNALLKFTVKDQEGCILATKTRKTDSWWNIWPNATCKFNTVNMPKGNHKLTITYYNPKDQEVKLAEKCYNFNVI